MKLVFTSLFVAALSLNVLAQDNYSFDYVEQRLDESEIVETDVRKHYMGDVIARKMLLLNDSYVFFEGTSPQNPLPTRQVDKYAIYNSVKKLNAYYKKAIKKGVYTAEEGTKRFKRVLDVALCVRYQNTIDLEAKLLETKDAESLDDIFVNKVILDGLYEDAITRVE